MMQIPSDYQAALQTCLDHNLGKPDDGLRVRRSEAFQRFLTLGFPDQHQEAWRYTSVQRLLDRGYSFEETEATADLTDLCSRLLPEPVAARLLFVDGRFQPQLSRVDSPDLQLTHLAAEMAGKDRDTRQLTGRLSGSGEDAFAAMNMVAMRDGAIIRVPNGISLQQPIELLHVATAAAAGYNLNLRHQIALGAGADATLVERHLSLGDDDYFHNLVCEVVLGEDAALQHQRIQQESMQAFHLSAVYLELKARARYRAAMAAVGGAWSRTLVKNRFSAPGASSEIDGFYLAGDGQLVDFHLDIDHAVPNCESRQNFKGIVHGRGRAVFDGAIRVKERAQKSNAHLHNANLMLSHQAEIDTKPQLEILADDVQCSHGTSVGQLEEEAIFYLRSRGLDENSARRLLCLGFAGEILDRFGFESLQRDLQALVSRSLEGRAAQADPETG
jgi:Fe-S cluster assembly protein SufD